MTEPPAFADGKDADALRTIGEVARLLGIAAHVLRYWERQFPMLRPMQRGGGRRYYRPQDIALVRTIDRLVNREGYTLKGALAVIRDAGRDAALVPTAAVTPPVPVAAAPAGRAETAPPMDEPERTALLADLRILRARLANTLER